MVRYPKSPWGYLGSAALTSLHSTLRSANTILRAINEVTAKETFDVKCNVEAQERVRNNPWSGFRKALTSESWIHG